MLKLWTKTEQGTEKASEATQASILIWALRQRPTEMKGLLESACEVPFAVPYRTVHFCRGVSQGHQ